MGSRLAPRVMARDWKRLSGRAAWVFEVLGSRPGPAQPWAGGREGWGEGWPQNEVARPSHICSLSMTLRRNWVSSSTCRG